MLIPILASNEQDLACNIAHIVLKKKKKKGNGSSKRKTYHNASQNAKEPSAPYIQGPMMDWSMNDDLYSHFQTWQIACNLIFDSELCDLPES